MSDITETIPIAVGVLVLVTGVMAGLLYVIRAEVKKGNREMVPNHGSSLRDAVDRIELRQAEDREMYLSRISEVHDDVKAIVVDARADRARLDHHIDNHERSPRA